MDHDNDTIPNPSGKDVSWVKSRKQSKNFTYFFAKPIVINATTDEVWAIEKDVKHYEKFSDYAVGAKLQGDLEVNKTIVLDLYTNKLIGKVIPTSKERISIVDEKIRYSVGNINFDLSKTLQKGMQYLKKIQEIQIKQ